jgi:hypothetical protein
MGRFDISPQTADEYRTKFREGVQPHLGEEVLAVGTFRSTGAGTRYGISKLQLGALAYAASSLRGKKQAGGLPSSFLLAVTPTKVHAFAYKTRTRGIAVKDEVAVWERSGLQVSTERLKTTTRVRLEWPGDESLVCDQDGMGDNPWADDVVRVLSAG